MMGERGEGWSPPMAHLTPRPPRFGSGRRDGPDTAIASCLAETAEPSGSADPDEREDHVRILPPRHRRVQAGISRSFGAHAAAQVSLENRILVVPGDLGQGPKAGGLSGCGASRVRAWCPDEDRRHRRQPWHWFGARSPTRAPRRRGRSLRPSQCSGDLRSRLSLARSGGTDRPTAGSPIPRVLSRVREWRVRQLVEGPRLGQTGLVLPIGSMTICFPRSAVPN